MEIKKEFSRWWEGKQNNKTKKKIEKKNPRTTIEKNPRW